MRETEIQSKIKRKLEAAGWFVTKLIQTTTNGIPDLLALKDGTAIFIEVKRLGQKPTALQAYRHKQLTDYGFAVIVATETNDILHLCSSNPPEPTSPKGFPLSPPTPISAPSSRGKNTKKRL